MDISCEGSVGLLSHKQSLLPGVQHPKCTQSPDTSGSRVCAEVGAGW